MPVVYDEGVADRGMTSFEAYTINDEIGRGGGPGRHQIEVVVNIFTEIERLGPNRSPR